MKGLVPTEKETRAIKQYVRKSLEKADNLKSLKYKEVYVFGGTMRAIYKLYDAMPYQKKKTNDLIRSRMYWKQLR